jgi:hypothetical protein
MMSAIRTVQGLQVFSVRMHGKSRRNGRYTAGQGVSSEPVTILAPANGSGDKDAMAHQPANPNADQPAAEDASSPETVISVPTAEGEMSGDRSLTRPADDTAGARSAATASLLDKVAIEAD